MYGWMAWIYDDIYNYYSLHFVLKDAVGLGMMMMMDHGT